MNFKQKGNFSVYLFTPLLPCSSGISCGEILGRENTRQDGQYLLHVGDDIYEVREKAKKNFEIKCFEGSMINLSDLRNNDT